MVAYDPRTVWSRDRGKQRNMKQPGELVTNPKFDKNLAKYEQGRSLRLGSSCLVPQVLLLLLLFLLLLSSLSLLSLALLSSQQNNNGALKMFSFI